MATDAVRLLIERYSDAWNAHDIDAIVAMAVCEWTAGATHSKSLRRGDLVAGSGRSLI